MKRQDFVIEGQLIELGQASELTRGMLDGRYFEIVRYLYLDTD